MCSHWFSASQWKLPNKEQYQQLQTLFSSKGQTLNFSHGELCETRDKLQKTYALLIREHEELKQEYDNLRRTFSVTADVPYTDVWTYAPVAYYAGKHPCEKPAQLLEHIISVSSKENNIVLDAFMGSGSNRQSLCKVKSSVYWC